ncbi:MAG: lipoate-protein ligase B [Alphaproteobacteria bacterium]
MPPEWKISRGLTPYEEALSYMDERVAKINEGSAGECVWLLEHPPLYTAGTSAKDTDLLDARFPVYKSGRGGQYTYHGPGQRVAYVMLDLKKRSQNCIPRESGDLGCVEKDSRFRGKSTGSVPDIKKYVCSLEEWIIRTLAEFDVRGERRDGRIGIWVDTPAHPAHAGDVKSEKKIAAVGVRIRHWVTLHGISINVNPDLTHFSGIVPCGIAEHGVTSLWEWGVKASMQELDEALKKQWPFVFSQPRG